MNNVDWWIFPYDEEKKTTWTQSQLHPRVTITTSYFFTVLNSVDNQYSSTFHVIFYQEIVLNSTFLFCTLVTHSYAKPISYGKKNYPCYPIKKQISVFQRQLWTQKNTRLAIISRDSNLSYHQISHAVFHERLQVHTWHEVRGTQRINSFIRLLLKECVTMNTHDVIWNAWSSKCCTV